MHSVTIIIYAYMYSRMEDRTEEIAHILNKFSILVTWTPIELFKSSRILRLRDSHYSYLLDSTMQILSSWAKGRRELHLEFQGGKGI